MSETEKNIRHNKDMYQHTKKRNVISSLFWNKSLVKFYNQELSKLWYFVINISQWLERDAFPFSCKYSAKEIPAILWTESLNYIPRQNRSL